MAISTHDLSAMPNIELLRRVLQSVSMLEAILASGLGYRADYQFDAHWQRGIQLAVWNNGQGDNCFFVFDSHGCWIKGFAHEAEMTPFRRRPPQVWPGMYDGMPKPFERYLKEPAFESSEVATFCIWRLKNDRAWRRGKFQLPPLDMNQPPLFRDADLSSMILADFEKNSDEWAIYESENYDREVDAHVVRQIFSHEPLQREWISKLDSRASVEECHKEALKIGFPIGKAFRV